MIVSVCAVTGKTASYGMVIANGVITPILNRCHRYITRQEGNRLEKEEIENAIAWERGSQYIEEKSW